MTLTASDANELLCDNNTVKTHHDNRSDFLRKLGFLDKIFSKKHFFDTDLFYSFFVFSPEKIGELTDQMVGYNLTTKQTPPDGVLVQKVNNDSIRI